MDHKPEETRASASLNDVMYQLQRRLPTTGRNRDHTTSEVEPEMKAAADAQELGDEEEEMLRVETGLSQSQTPT